ncbi:MAG: sulfatase [Myxococcota bacterium]
MRVILGALLVTLAACAPAERRSPNVVVVLIDTLRPDHLQLGGYPEQTSPFLDGVAARSTVFLDAVSASSWTAPSTASIFTSVYPQQHGVVEGWFAARALARKVRREGHATLPLNRIREDLATLPELLREAGYRTFGISTNVNVGPEMGFDQGFESFYRFPLVRPAQDLRLHQIGTLDVQSEPAEQVYRKLVEWEGRIRGKEGAPPYFLYLHFNDPHRPYNPRAPWFRDSDDPDRRALSAYDSEIHYLDGWLEKIWDRLGLQRDTIVVWVSDHGEGFGDHGEYAHRWGLYRELNHALFVIYGPGYGILAQRISERVAAWDLLPTLLDLLGLKAPPERVGWSLAPLVRRGPGAETLRRKLEKRRLFAHRERRTVAPGEVWAVFSGPWKLIDDIGRIELYDTRNDVSEQRDRADAEPEIVGRLRARLDAFKGAMSRVSARRAGASGATAVEIDSETLRQLQGLGYAE